MKKHLLSVIVAGSSILTCQNLFAGNGIIRCASTEYRAREEKLDPSITVKRAQIERDIQNYIQQQMLKPNPVTHAVITIPIVFHVVYKTQAENVSDACIAATLKAFNEDFRKQNADFTTRCPAAFQSLAADCEIQFCMASKDPSGAATNGITRTSTTITSFVNDDKMKYTAQGGHDNWDHTKYENMWLCNMGPNLLGYGAFPGGSPGNDGVVCHSSFLMGSAGCGGQPYELGRTTIHELGHFFGLPHIWGDDGNQDNKCTSNECAQDDGISDTPPQADAHFSGASYSHPLHANMCSGSTNGEMYMNYMDYTEDAYMVMFTLGQKARILSTINTFRSGLITSAASLCAPVGINEISLNQNVYIYPNPSTGDFIINVENAGVSSADISVYNALGEAVLQKRIVVPASGEMKVDLNNKPDGIYLIKMKTSEGTVTKKVILNR